MLVQGQKRTWRQACTIRFGPIADITILFDHLVGNQQKVASNRKAQCSVTNVTQISLSIAIGRERIRRPLARYTAFAIATDIPTVPISPMPLIPAALNLSGSPVYFLRRDRPKDWPARHSVERIAYGSD